MLCVEMEGWGLEWRGWGCMCMLLMVVRRTSQLNSYERHQVINMRMSPAVSQSVSQSVGRWYDPSLASPEQAHIKVIIPTFDQML